MLVKSYVLVETEVGTAKAVTDRLRELSSDDATVTGPQQSELVRLLPP